MQLSRMAHRDALTGLYNRAMFDDALQHQLAQAMRLDAQFAVLYIDLDKFKEINDRLGHAAGDELLRETARRLLDATRASDLVRRGSMPNTMVPYRLAWKRCVFERRSRQHEMGRGVDSRVPGRARAPSASRSRSRGRSSQCGRDARNA